MEQQRREAAAKQKMAFEHADAGSAVPETGEAVSPPAAPQPTTRAQPKVGRNDPCPVAAGKSTSSAKALSECAEVV